MVLSAGTPSVPSSAIGNKILTGSRFEKAGAVSTGDGMNWLFWHSQWQRDYAQQTATPARLGHYRKAYNRNNA
jgi:hypothetical protein